MYPLSGSERQYFLTGKWNDYKTANNCYAYAVGSFRKWRPHKSIPGNGARNHNYSRCGFKDLVLLDGQRNNGGIKEWPLHAKCPKNYYKVVSYTSPQGDFHWLVQHGIVNHRVKSRDTIKGIANFYEIPEARVMAAAKAVGGMAHGKTLKLRCNTWSHKRGWSTPPLLTGSDGRRIRGPKSVVMDYPGLNYSQRCKSYAVRTYPPIRVGALSNFNMFIY